MDREKTGIKKVDLMIEGGFPKESIVGISGPPGVGKSLFALHFLLEGARQGQKCLYINLEEPLENINKMIKGFSFSEEFNKYIKNEKIVVRCYTYTEYEKIYTALLKKIREEKNIQRVVIDSFNCFFSSVFVPNISEEETNIKKMISQSFDMLRRKGLTSFLVLEKPNGEGAFHYNVPYFLDGLINLDFLELGTIERRIFIPKMRWTNQFKESKSFDISKKGIIISDEEDI